MPARIRARVRDFWPGFPVACRHQLESYSIAVSAWVHDVSPESNVSSRCLATYKRLITVPRGTSNAFDNSS